MTNAAPSAAAAVHTRAPPTADAALETVRPGSSAPLDVHGGQITAEAAKRIPHKPLITYRIVQGTIGPLARLLLRVEPVGFEKIPRKGPVILASNHVSWFDPVVVVASLRRPLSALGKSYLFRGRFRTWFFETLAGQIRVDRERRGNLAAVKAAVTAVQNGKLIGVWPEGGRSPTGHLTRGKTGVARIALASGAAVYPVATIGTFDLKAKHTKGIRWGTRVRVVVGDPLTFPDFVGQQHDREVCRAVTDEVMLAIARLMGPEEEALYRELLRQDVPPGELPLDKAETA